MLDDIDKQEKANHKTSTDEFLNGFSHIRSINMGSPQKSL